MAVPTYSQIMAELGTWEANPNQRHITGPKLVALLKQYIQHLTNNGAYDPGTFQQQLTDIIATYPNRFSTFFTNVFVNQVTGNDNNSGFSNDSPVKTLNRAAELINWKFQRANIYIQGDYNVIDNVIFHVNELTINLESNKTLTFKKRIIEQGETVNAIRIDGLYLKIEGANDATAKIVTETNAGHLRADPYWVKATLGAIKLGNGDATFFSFLPSLFNLYNVKVQLGNNTALVTGSNGMADAFFFNYHVRFEHNVTDWTQGQNTWISPYCKSVYYRKSILFNNTNNWQLVGTQADLLLHDGTYAVRVAFDSWQAGGSVYRGYYSGIFSWHGQTTNDELKEARELAPLHGMGHNINGRTLSLRTVAVKNDEAPAGQGQRIEAKFDEVLSKAINVEFYFTKLT